MENTEQYSQPTPVHQVPLTLRQELSLLIRNMPSWLFALMSLFGIFFSYQIVGGGLLLLAFGLDVTAVNITAYRWATMLGQLVFILGPTLLLAKLRFPHVANVFRFGRFRIGEILLVLLAVFALQQLLQGYMLMQDSVPLPLPPSIKDLIDKMKDMMEVMYRQLTVARSFPEFLFVLLVIAVTPAICEELMFRGLIQRTLEESSPGPVPQPSSPSAQPRRGMQAAMIAGVIFGLYHLNPFSLVPLVALGVFFGFIVYRSQNIVPAMVAHFFNNFLACLAVYLNLDEEFLAIAPMEHPTTTLLAMNFGLSALVFGAATWYFVHITKAKAPSHAL